MDYEHRYKDALRRAKKLYGEGTITECLDWVFPELEDENERIKREILELVSIAGNGNQFEEIKDWLEKQGEKTNPYSGVSFEYNGHIWGMCARDNGIEIAMDGKPVRQFSYKDCEQTFGGKSALEAAKEEKVDNQNCINPADKVEPKFHEGEWLQYRNAKPFFVEEITKQGYVNGDSCLPFEWEDEIHLWTIQDAKNGDVLSGETDGEVFIFLFNQIQDKWIVAHGYYSETDGEFIEKAYLHRRHGNLFSPATKEQRYLLFQKMKEAGYEWDTERKEMKKIESKTFNG